MDSETPTNPRVGPLDEVSDRLRRTSRGDAESLAWIADWLRPMMVGWVKVQLRSRSGGELDPEDLVQDAWVRVLSRLGEGRWELTPSGRITPPFLAFVKTVLRNLVIDAQRQVLRRRIRSLSVRSESRETIISPDSGPVSKLAKGDRENLIQNALEKIGERDRALYLRRIFEDLSIGELAAEYGMREDAVVKARQRVRQKLEELLGANLVAELEAR